MTSPSVSPVDWERLAGKVLRRVNRSVKLAREATQLIISLGNLRLQEQKRFEKSKTAGTNDAISEASPAEKNGEVNVDVNLKNHRATVQWKCCSWLSFAYA